MNAKNETINTQVQIQHVQKSVALKNFLKKLIHWLKENDRRANEIDEKIRATKSNPKYSLWRLL